MRSTSVLLSIKIFGIIWLRTNYCVIRWDVFLTVCCSIFLTTLLTRKPVLRGSAMAEYAWLKTNGTIQSLNLKPATTFVFKVWFSENLPLQLVFIKLFEWHSDEDRPTCFFLQMLGIRHQNDRSEYVQILNNNDIKSSFYSSTMIIAFTSLVCVLLEPTFLIAQGLAWILFKVKFFPMTKDRGNCLIVIVLHNSSILLLKQDVFLYILFRNSREFFDSCCKSECALVNVNYQTCLHRHRCYQF